MSQPAATLPTVDMRIGAFAVRTRLPDPDQRLGKAALFAVEGEPGSKHAGATGHAFVSTFRAPEPAVAKQLSALLARIEQLCGDAIVPILEARPFEAGAYVVESSVPGRRLSDMLASDGRFTPVRTAKVVAQLASALQLAHDGNVSHGMVSPSVVWVDAGDAAKLGGFGIAGRGPARDQEQLAHLAVEMLAGKRWAPPSGGAAPSVEQLRCLVGGLTEGLAKVILRGLDPDPAARFPDVAAFGEAFVSEVRDSAAEVAGGAWEAVARGDVPMAKLLIELLGDYDPSSPELALLRLRLDESALHDPGRVAEALSVPLGVRREETARLELAGGNNEATNREADFLRLLSQPGAATQPARGNPWVVFMTVVFAMIALLAVIAAISFTRV